MIWYASTPFPPKTADPLSLDCNFTQKSVALQWFANHCRLLAPHLVFRNLKSSTRVSLLASLLCTVVPIFLARRHHVFLLSKIDFSALLSTQ